MCEQETAIRAAVALGMLQRDTALALHAERCDRCAVAALDAALSRVGLGTSARNLEDTDEFQVALAVVGLETRVSDRPRDADSSGLIELSSLGLEGTADPPFSLGARPGGRSALGAPVGPASTPMRTLPMPTRRRRFAGLLPLAAGLFVAVGAMGGAWFTLHGRDEGELSNTDGRQVPRGVVLASSPLSAVAPAGALAASPLSAVAPSPLNAVAPSPLSAVAPAGALAAAQVPAAQAPAQSGDRIATASRRAPAGAATPAPQTRVTPGGAPGPALEGPTSDSHSPVAAAAGPPLAPARPAPQASDDVDDLLGALDGKGTRATGGANPGGGGEVLLPEQLSKPQILGVVKRATASVASCRERQPAVSGTVMVVIRIGPSGKVSTATAKPPFAGTPVGGCIEGLVRALRFPEFAGDPMTLNLPFAL